MICPNCNIEMKLTYEPYEERCGKCGYWFDHWTGSEVTFCQECGSRMSPTHRCMAGVPDQPSIAVDPAQPDGDKTVYAFADNGIWRTFATFEGLWNWLRDHINYIPPRID